LLAPIDVDYIATIKINKIKIPVIVKNVLYELCKSPGKSSGYIKICPLVYQIKVE
jgi:hypothetical protein